MDELIEKACEAADKIHNMPVASVADREAGLNDVIDHIRTLIEAMNC